MFLYLAFTNIELNMPTAVEIAHEGDYVVLRDKEGRVVLRIGAVHVSLYSERRLDLPGSDGNLQNPPPV